MRQNEATPLLVAALNGHTDTVLALLQAGAIVDAKDEVRGVLLSLMSSALALLLSLSCLALFFSLSFFVALFFLNLCVYVF
jgi:hypothetical protein